MTSRVRTEPSAAEAARTALATWSAGSLLLRRCPAGGRSWGVDLEGGVEGRPVLVVEPGSPVVAALRACPVGVLVLPPAGPPDRSVLRLTARFTPLRGASTDGRRRYRSELLAVCLVGPGRRPVEPAAFAAAEPDPLRQSAARVVDHLASRHRGELLACLRAQGYDALDVVPRAVDGYGLSLAVLDADGVRAVRLPFPGGPVRDADLDAGWALPLRCACP
ncbi:DUF2470 domain-containing protein [Lapillicoccus jejuensis]|uniref:DUF2470 domain-containing protein n=1 Tax=Lapillicoccus jejuensis TaxID=402171 RepID=A0A542E1C3_9MICO|nr:DUF2470 domain-containing protein [Lapillicoccus jejuensis]TQJ09004.1 hypothetical protein FB458_2106 [Lapillicoccus jejuensis]